MNSDYVRYDGPIIHEDKEYSDAITELERKAALVKEYMATHKSLPSGL